MNRAFTPKLEDHQFECNSLETEAYLNGHENDLNLTQIPEKRAVMVVLMKPRVCK